MFDNLTLKQETLEKIKVRPRILTSQMSIPTPIQRHVDDVSRVNQNLANCLLNPRMPLPLLHEMRGLQDRRKLFHQDHDMPTDVFNAIRKAYVCRCKEPHVANFGCKCLICKTPFEESRSGEDKWACEILFPPKSLPTECHKPI